MKQLACIGAALAVSMVINHAQAQEVAQPTFNYVAVTSHQVDVEVDDFEEFDGFGVDLGFDFTDTVFAEIQYFDVSDNTSNYLGATNLSAEFSVAQTYANVGYKFYQQGGTAMYISGGYTRAKATFDLEGYSSESTSDSGWNAQIGVRSRFSEYVEVDANVRHYDMGDDVSDQEVAITGRFYVSDTLSLLAGYTAAADDANYVRFGASWKF